jgi:hypothetical protein
MNMIELEYNTALKVSDEIIQTHVALDEALMQLSSLTQSMVQASRNAQLKAGDNQKALEAVSDGISGLMTSRKGFVSAHKHMIAIKGLSNQRETDFGCLGNGPVRGKSPLRIAA